MANEQRPEVNQRLYFCRLHLGFMSSEFEKQKIARTVVEQALAESTVLHLMLAYRAYLREIAMANGIAAEKMAGAQELIAVLSGQGHQAAEADELLALEQDGWLGELLLLYQGLADQAPASPHSGSAQGIALTQLASEERPTFERCQQYFNRLTDIIENQRTRMEEW